MKVFEAFSWGFHLNGDFEDSVRDADGNAESVTPSSFLFKHSLVSRQSCGSWLISGALCGQIQEERLNHHGDPTPPPQTAGSTR